jgi:hypothetical protein
MATKKDMRKAIKACVAAGLVFDPDHKHPRIVDPATGKFVVLSSSPSCPHAAKNMLTDVRKILGREVHM